jgi:hypothetical protein
MCAIFLLGTFVALFFVPPAFTDPAPDFKSIGSIDTLIASTGEETNNDPGRWNNRIFIHARYSQDSAVVYYTLWFPNKYAGRKFAFRLSGSAVMRNAHTEVKAPLTTEGWSCRDAQEQCQILYGVIPVEQLEPIVRGGPPDCSLDVTKQDNYTPVRISGDASIISDTDWVHHLTVLPDFTDTYSFDGHELRGTYATALQIVCKELELNPTTKLGDVSSVPTAADTTRLTWNSEFADKHVSVVTADRSAGAWGNLLIATAGLLAAISIGFMPVAYDARRRWRQSQELVKRQAPRPSRGRGSDSTSEPS